MRIGIDIQTLETFESQRGIGRLCRQTINALLEYARDVELVLFGRSPSLPKECQAGSDRVSYVQLGDVVTEEALRAGCASNFLWRTSRADELDLYHVTSPLMADILIPAVAPCPVVATLLDAIPAVMHEKRQPLLSSEEWERYQQRVATLRLWQGYAAISGATADDCLRHFSLKEERVVVTYVPIEQRPLARWDPQKLQDVCMRLELEPGYVLSVTGFHRRKNFEALFGAYGRLPRRLQERASLVIVCQLRPEERLELEKMAERAGCLPRVKFLGYIGDEEFSAVLANAGVMFFPSRYEGFGLPVAEAMAAGVPVVTSNCSSLPEVAGEAAETCDPDDHAGFAKALMRILESPDYAAELRAKGFAQVTQFSPENYVERLLGCYQNAMKRRGRGQPFVVSAAALSPCLRVAVFTPLSPKMSGIADFAEQLLLNLSADTEVECFTEDYELAHPIVRERIPIFPHWTFPSRHSRRPFDVILYEVGNNDLHAYMLPYLECHTGVIDLHDYSLTGMFQYLARHFGWGPEAQRWFAREMKVPEDHGTCSQLLATDPHKVTMTRWLAGQSQAVIVHSQWLLQQVLSIVGNSTPVSYVPLGVDLGMVRAPRAPRAELRRKYHISDDGFAIACVGVVNRLKRIPVVLEAFREFHAIFPNSYLVFVGPADRLVLREMTQLTAAYRLNHAVRLLGHRPLNELYEVLDLCDAVVNLRYPTLGESSATLVAALAMGKPTLITPHAAFAEYPDNVCLKVPVGRREKQVLLRYLGDLYENPRWRAELGENAKKHVESWAFHVVARRYEELLLSVKNGAKPSMPKPENEGANAT